jgi:hypothetical protein
MKIFSKKVFFEIWDGVHAPEPLFIALWQQNCQRAILLIWTFATLDFCVLDIIDIEYRLCWI